jgi:hypothetical protein
MVAACFFFPPWEAIRSEPLLTIDHPVHTHRVHVFRQALIESGWPWGYDPRVAAGMVMDPHDGLGAKPQQVLGVLLPFLSPGMVVRLFLFIVILTFPMWTLLACRILGIPDSVQVWIMIAFIAPAWLSPYFIGYIQWGLVAFAAASYFAPCVIALFLRFLDKPGLKFYLAFSIAAAALFLLHPVGPVAIAPPLVLFTLIAYPMDWRWRIALIIVPVIVLSVNAFWFLPYELSKGAGWPIRPPVQGLDAVAHLKFTAWSQLIDRINPLWLFLRISPLALVGFGFILLSRLTGRRVAIAFALASAFVIFLNYFGSFLPFFAIMQPRRFQLSIFVLLTIPIGVAIYTFVKKLGLPPSPTAAALAIIIAAWTGFYGEIKGLPLPASPDPLAEFVAQHTDITDRLFVQSIDGYKYVGYEARALPLVLDREVIGCTFPMVRDPAQFLSNIMFGKEITSWSPEEILKTLERWGISWIFTKTEEAHALFEKTFDTPGRIVGEYRAFHMPGSFSPFLIGGGRVKAHVNRFELTELTPEDGLVVLRYRYHPAWKTNLNLPVQQYPVPEDPAGFIALENPPSSVILKFDAKLYLNAPWRKNS